MARSTLSVARTGIAARTGVTARTAINSFRIPEVFYEIGVTGLWSFRNGFNGTNGTNISGDIGSPLSANNITEGTFYTSGEYSGNFDASNDRCVSNIGARFHLPNATTITNYTVFNWIKRTNVGTAHVFSSCWTTSGNNRSFIFQANANNTLAFLCTSNGQSGTLATQTSDSNILNNTNWNFVAVTYVGATQTATLYIDGAVTASTTTTGTIPTSIFVGAARYVLGDIAQGGTPMDGKIGISGVASNTAMSTAQLLNIYTLTRQFYGV